MKRQTLLFTYGLLTTTKRFRNKPARSYEISDKPQQFTVKDKQTRVPTNSTRPLSTMNFKKLEEKS